MVIGLVEPTATALILAVFGALMVFSVVLTRTLDRFGVPVVLLFLVLGLLGGSEAIGKVAFDNFSFAYRMGTVALILILFDGGLNTRVASIRRSLAPAGMLATVGVAATAGMMALAGRAVGLGWGEAVLVGAIVSSTDAAAVFAVLRGGAVRIRDRVRSVLEVESCVNDPMAVLLTVTMIGVLRGSGSAGWSLAWRVPMELVIGAGVGVMAGLAMRWVLARASLKTAGLYPVATLAAAFCSYGFATMCLGSGFLAVFATGVVLGNGPLPYKTALARVHDAVAWMSQVAMFLMLGLLAFPSQLVPVAGEGLLLGLALAFVARPLAACACLLPMGWSLREVIFIGWVGLRGALPIILVTFPVMAGHAGAERIFHIVFFVVVVSALVPGASIVPLTRRLRMGDSEPPAPSAALEIHSLQHLDGMIRAYRVVPSVAVCGARLSEIAFPPGSSAILVVRGKELLAARGHTLLEAGDHVYVFLKPGDEPLIGLLFGAQTQ